MNIVDVASALIWLELILLLIAIALSFKNSAAPSLIIPALVSRLVRTIASLLMRYGLSPQLDSQFFVSWSQATVCHLLACIIIYYVRMSAYARRIRHTKQKWGI